MAFLLQLTSCISTNRFQANWAQFPAATHDHRDHRDHRVHRDHRDHRDRD